MKPLCLRDIRDSSAKITRDYAFSHPTIMACRSVAHKNILPQKPWTSAVLRCNRATRRRQLLTYSANKLSQKFSKITRVSQFMAHDPPNPWNIRIYNEFSRKIYNKVIRWIFIWLSLNRLLIVSLWLDKCEIFFVCRSVSTTIGWRMK